MVPKQSTRLSAEASPASLAPVVAEQTLQGLRSLWLAPTLILSVFVVLLIALGKSPLTSSGRPVWLVLALVLFVVVFTVVHRQAGRLAQTLRGQMSRETERLGQEVERAEARLEEQLPLATAAHDFAECILHNVPAAVLVLDAGEDSLIRSANSLAEALPAPVRRQSGLTGRRLGDVFPGLEVLLADPLRQAAQGDTVTLTDVSYGPRASGVTYWTFSLIPQRDPQTRRITQVIVFAAETIDRARSLRERERHAEESDRAARVERHRAVEWETTLTNLSDGVILCTSSGQFVSLNRAARGILGEGAMEPGESADAWAARIGFCYPSGQPVPPGAIPLNRTLRDGHVTESAEFRLTGDSGPRVVQFTSAPVVSPDGPGVSVGAVAVLRDVTELRQSRRQEAMANARIAALVQISRRLNRTLVESQIHAIVTEGALALLPEPAVSGARALLYGRDDGGLILLRTTPDEGPKRPRSRQRSGPLTLPFDAKSSLLWPLYVARQPVIARDVASDPSFAGEAERRFLQGASDQAPAARSALALPLVAGNVVTGHLLLTSLGEDTFDDLPLLDALTHLAALATIARANAGLAAQIRQRADEMDALWTVGQAAASQADFKDVVDALTERGEAIFGAELCTLSLWEPFPDGARRLRRQGTRHDDSLLPESDGPIRVNCGLCDAATQEAATSGRGATRLAVPNPSFGGCRWRAFSGQSGSHSVLSAPVRQGDETLGALTVFRTGVAPFTPEQTKLLQTLASLAVPAIRSTEAGGGE